MNEQFHPVGREVEFIDRGPRSNESAFGAFDPDPAKWRKEPLWPETSTDHGVASQVLPFTVGIVDTEETLERVQHLRVEAYGHHLPQLAASFGKPDPIDRLSDVTLFYAEDKATGRLVGSARLQINKSGPLQIERSLVLPPERRGKLLSEVTRLVVFPGYIPPVKLALVKALHLFCIANQIGGVVAGSRRSLLRQYLNLGFSDLYGDERMVPLAHGSNLEHRILFRDTVTSEADSRARNHPDHTFVFRTYHPDIVVFKDVLGKSSQALANGASERYSTKAA